MYLPLILYLVNSLLMTMKASRVNLVFCILYLWIAISCFIFDHNWNRVGTQRSNNVASLSSGEVRLYFLEIDLRSQIKTSWNFAVLPLLHLLHQKSPSSKSRIRVYLLLVDRDPTTTTHRIFFPFQYFVIPENLILYK